jgi:hypothetical protein
MIPLATTKQFRAAVRQVMNGKLQNKATYTDKPAHLVKSKYDTTRYVSYWLVKCTSEQIDQIEFILWCQGVTANTRNGRFSIRGTCELSKKD